MEVMVIFTVFSSTGFLRTHLAFDFLAVKLSNYLELTSLLTLLPKIHIHCKISKGVKEGGGGWGSLAMGVGVFDSVIDWLINHTSCPGGREVRGISGYWDDRMGAKTQKDP